MLGILGQGETCTRAPAPGLGARAAATSVTDPLSDAGPGRGYVFPEFLPAYDAIASLCKLLELLAPIRRRVSELVADLPQPTLVHRQLHCPFGLKGLVMRVLTERLKDRRLDLTDGVKVFDDRGWAQVLPDPDEPLLHLYAEGRTEAESQALADEFRQLVEEIMATEGVGAPV